MSYNYCADQLRLGKRLPSTSLDSAFLAEPTDSTEDYLQEETLRVVQRAMETLSPQDRDLLRLKYEDGLSVVDIAQLLAVKESTVKMRLMRSREKIRRLADPQLS